MLKDLTILNGDMPLQFDPLNTIYTITTASNETKLDFTYEIDEGNDISIFGNSLVPGHNELVITVYNDTEMMSYYLDVYKEETMEVSSDLNTNTTIEVSKREQLFEYAAPSIAAICFFIILLLFTLLFSKKKNYRK